MRNRFTEQETEAFYDAEDALYRSFWDEEGSLHWGWFDQETGEDFLAACTNLNRVMVEKAQIEPISKVLDLGCGNGNTSRWLGHRTGCKITGIDLSGVRIENAKESMKGESADAQARITFEKASATSLPFDNEAFSHIWSQATIYHIHDKEKALQEAYRVLDDGGIFIFDDLTKPKADISDDARQYVYDRLLFDTDYSFSTYQDALGDVGFQVLEAHDLSAHLKRSYQCLAKMALDKKDLDTETFQTLSDAYHHMVRAADRGELGWGLYVCRK